MRENTELGSNEREVHIPIKGWRTISADMTVPQDAEGLVLFAHGSGSSRFSPRNRYVAQIMQEKFLATILIDLLTPTEESIDAVSRNLRFDIKLLSERVVAAIRWLRDQEEIGSMKIGCFGASTGAAAALAAAARMPDEVSAVVSRGGRPDLAGKALAQVKAPTFLIVGGDDAIVIDLNRQAMEQLTCEKQMAVVSGAGHLFEEPGKMERVADLAAGWFARYLVRQPVGGHQK
ncbi:MAG: dienelactone hydrolase family protein [Phycisphaerae bacterium]|nr:dienelactone hydrolase family protein [Phycisphaerae bacterium]